MFSGKLYMKVLCCIPYRSQAQHGRGRANNNDDTTLLGERSGMECTGNTILKTSCDGIDDKSLSPGNNIAQENSSFL